MGVKYITQYIFTMKKNKKLFFSLLLMICSSCGINEDKIIGYYKINQTTILLKKDNKFLWEFGHKELGTHYKYSKGNWYIDSKGYLTLDSKGIYPTVDVNIKPTNNIYSKINIINVGTIENKNYVVIINNKDSIGNLKEETVFKNKIHSIKVFNNKDKSIILEKNGDDNFCDIEIVIGYGVNFFLIKETKFKVNRKYLKDIVTKEKLMRIKDGNVPN